MVALLAFGRSVAVASEAHGMARLQQINTWTGLLDIDDEDDFADGRRVVLASPSTPSIGTGRLQAWGTAAWCELLTELL